MNTYQKFGPRAITRCVRCGDKTEKGGEEGAHYMYKGIVPVGSKYNVEANGWHCDWCYRLILSGFNMSDPRVDVDVKDLEGLT